MKKNLTLLGLTLVILLASCKKDEWSLRNHCGQQIVRKDITQGKTMLFIFRSHDGGIEQQEPVSEQTYNHYEENDVVICH